MGRMASFPVGHLLKLIFITQLLCPTMLTCITLLFVNIIMMLEDTN